MKQIEKLVAEKIRCGQITSYVNCHGTVIAAHRVGRLGRLSCTPDYKGLYKVAVGEIKTFSPFFSQQHSKYLLKNC